MPTALAIHPLSKLRDLSKLRGILANRIKALEQLTRLFDAYDMENTYIRKAAHAGGDCIFIAAKPDHE